MKKIGSLFWALWMLLSLCACTSAPAPQPAETEPAETEPAPTQRVEPEAPDPVADLIEQLLADEEGLLLAARRATAQAFDRLWYDCPPDDAFLKEYYSGVQAQVSDSALLQRAQVLSAVTAEADRLKHEDGKVLYRTALPRDGEWETQWVELELETPDGPSKTVTEGFITAELENERVFLSFADTEEANYYLLGWGDIDYDYQEDGRVYEMPGDTLPLGPEHRYEVKGLFSHYRDLFVGGLSGFAYRPYLFLVTEDNTLEMVDITTCFQYGFFCAMPLPGHFEASSLSAPVRRMDEFGDDTVIVTGSGGEECDLSRYATYARGAVPRDSWSGSVGEVTDSSGSWSIIANLDFRDTMYTGFSVTELDLETRGGDVDMITLGMTEDGIVSACKWYTWRMDGFVLLREGADCCAMAWCSGVEFTEYETLEFFQMKQLSGLSPLCDLGETVKLYQSEFEAVGALTEAVTPFVGEWIDTVSGRCYLTVTTFGLADEAYIRVEWGDSATASYVWTMSGIPGQLDAALSYDDCSCQIVEYGAHGDEIVKETLYTDGCGSIVLVDVDTFLWTDENYAQSRDCRFAPVNAVG